MNLFESVAAGSFSHVMDENQILDEYITEAYTPKDIPYMRVTPKRMIFPKGQPVGRGELAFLYSDSLSKTIELMRGEENLSMSKNTYYYFYNLHYRGTFFNKRYNQRMHEERKDIYERIKTDTGHKIYNRMVIPANENRNILYDLTHYLELFNSYCKKVSLMKKIKAFWGFLESIVVTPAFEGYRERFVVVNLSQWKLGKTIRDNIQNPIYLLYYTAYRMPDLLKSIDIDFIFYAGNKALKINPATLGGKDYRLLKVEMLRLYRSVNMNIDESILDEDKILNDEAGELASETLTTVVKQTDNPVVSEEIGIIEELDSDDTTTKKIEKYIADAKSEVLSIATPVSNGNRTTQSEIAGKIAKLAEEKMDSDEELLKEIYVQNQKKKVPSQPVMSARDKELKEKQEELVVKGLTVRELRKRSPKEIEIPVQDVSGSLTTSNKNMAQLKFNNFDKTYTEKLMPKDLVDAIMSLNDKSIPMYVRDIKVEDTSDELNYKETYTIALEDANRQRHTVKVDIPKFIDGKFMYIGGNKKVIKKQNFFFPVVKTDGDTVQIVTNYNKMFIRRVDTRSMSSIERLFKLIKSNESFSSLFIPGNAGNVNANFITTVEYDEISRSFIRFKPYDDERGQMFFSQAEAVADMEEKGFKPKKGYMYIGTNMSKGPIFINTETQRDDNGHTIIDLILGCAGDEYTDAYKKIKAPKRLVYTKVKVMEQDIAVILLLCYWEGLTKVLKKMGVKYEFVDMIPKTLSPTQNYIKFNDTIILYEETVPIALLMNGLNQISTTDYSIADMDTDIPYSLYFKKVYGKLSIMNALMNFYEFTIDPITLEILQDISLPTDIVNLMIYAVSLLADSQYVIETNQRFSRVRSNEIIPGILYEALAKNYINYKNSNGKKKFSIPQDIVIKNILALKTVEDYSTLNPTVELNASHALSVKGFRGTNLDRAFTVPKRAYDPSMVGIISPGTAPDGNCGISKTLSMEPNITNLRGYGEIKDKKLDELKDVNLFSPSELTIPLGTMNDDAVRLGHALKQSSHVVPVKKSSPVLISNGVEEVVRFKLSTDFCVNAEEGGEVVYKDDKMMIVKYKSGKHQAVKLTGTIVKNAGGGFFLSNTLVTDLNLGDKFKKDAVLGYHKDFFTNSKYNNCRMNMGTLAKVAIMSTYNTYEDATVITNKLSKDASTEMCFEKKVVIGKNSNIIQMVKQGDHIVVGQSLVSFDTSYDDSDLNTLLAHLGDDDKETIMANSRNDVPSKYAGVIEEIKIYSTVDLEELSPSLRKIVGDYYKEIKKRNDILAQYDPDNKDGLVKCGILCNETTKTVSPNKFGTVKGEKAEDSVVIEFYIKHAEPLEIGSKLANFTALKNTVGEIIPQGYEPWSEYRPEEEVSTIIASNSILKRMTPSILLTALGNKCIIELKRHLEPIFKKGGSMYREDMMVLIIKFFDAFDKTKTNSKKYRALFEPMSDAQFKNYFKGFFLDENAYLILDIVDYEHTITMEDIERAANVLKVPLFEHVYMPHLSMDKNNVIGTTTAVPVGWVPIKRTQQTVMKKNGLSTSIDKRSAITGQVTAQDKNGRQSDLENAMLVSLGMDYVLKELNGPRADDLVMKQQMLRQISLNGYVDIDDLENDVTNKTTLNTVNTYLLGMGLHSDLVTKGLMLPSTLKKEG